MSGTGSNHDAGGQGRPARRWRRSASCANSTCVEVAVGADAVWVRDSKNPSVALEFTPAEWDAFTHGVTAGEFDLRAERKPPAA